VLLTSAEVPLALLLVVLLVVLAVVVLLCAGAAVVSLLAGGCQGLHHRTIVSVLHCCLLLLQLLLLLLLLLLLAESLLSAAGSLSATPTCACHTAEFAIDQQKTLHHQLCFTSKFLHCTFSRLAKASATVLIILSASDVPEQGQQCAV
jgi:hypothetical protein